MFSHRVRIFRLFGFTVWIDWSWLFLAILIVWTLAFSYFPRLAPNLSEAIYWWMGIVGLFGLAFSIVVHEFAHSLVARRYHMPIRGITLFVFGGVAEMQEEPTSAIGEFWMALAGPLTSFALAVIFNFIAHAIVTAGEGLALSPVAAVVTYLAFVNGLLALFNLIPAFPLDGGRILRSALWGWKGDILWATRIAGAVGSFFGFGLIALGVLSALTGNIVTGIWWFLLGMFLQMAARASVEQRITRSRLSGVPVSRLMRRDPLTVSPDLSIERLVRDYFQTHFVKLFPVVALDGRLVGCVDIRDIGKVDSAEWPLRTVRDVMERCSDDNSIAEASDAALALEQMQRTRKSRFLVVEDGKLMGILALRDLIDFLAIKAELPA